MSQENTTNAATKVSVLIPAYNTNLIFLKEAIDSILSQTHQNFELIILNDSPDNKEIENVVLSYTDERIKYFKNEKNLGRALSRNRLIELAECEYIAFLDSDDIAMPTRLQKQVNYLNEHPEVDLVGSLMDCFGKTNKHVIFPEYDTDIKVELMNRCSIAQGSIMLRKSIIVQNNVWYRWQYRYAEDYRFFIDLFPYATFYNIQETLSLYRIHGNNSINQFDKKYRKQLGKGSRLEARSKYSAYWECYKEEYFSIKLFGIIPLLKRKRKWVYLFGFIPFIKIQ